MDIEKPKSQQYYTTQEAAEILRISPITLCNWRNAGRGPAFSRIGRKYLYSHRAIVAFFNENIARKS